MHTNHIIPAALTTVLASAAVLATAGSASAGFEPTIPGLDTPVIDQPVVTPVCEDVKSPKYGWCLPDITTQFDNVSPTFRSDGSAFIASRIHNEGFGTDGAVWSTVTVERSDLVGIMPLWGSAEFEVEQSWFDPDTFFIVAPDGLKVDEYLYVGFIFEEGDNIGVEIEANFHADAEEYDVLGLGDYRIDERRYENNTDAYRYSFG